MTKNSMRDSYLHGTQLAKLHARWYKQKLWQLAWKMAKRENIHDQWFKFHERWLTKWFKLSWDTAQTAYMADSSNSHEREIVSNTFPGISEELNVLLKTSVTL